MDKEQWHKQRNKAIGASEAAAILGVDPWQSALEVWARKTGRIAWNTEEAEHMKWGHLLEPVIIEEYSRRRNIGVRRFPQDEVVRHEEYPDVPMACTPDGEDEDGRLVQIKTTSAWNADKWRDEPPIHVQVQEQHEMAVMGRDVSVVAALIGGQRLGLWEIERNEAFIEALKEKLSKWWTRYVLTDEEPPAIDGDEKTIRALERLHPNDSGEEIFLGDEFIGMDQDLLGVKSQIKLLQAKQKEIENKIKGAIGAATFGLLPGGEARYSWKTQERAGYVVSDTKFRVLRRTK